MSVRVDKTGAQGGVAEIDQFGAGRVIRSLRLLKWCVADALATSELAFAMYREMKDADGFLPEIQLEWFSEGDS